MGAGHAMTHVAQAVNPVTVGKVRARQDYYEQKLDSPCECGLCCLCHTSRRPTDKSLCFQVHGDAAFAGQV